MPVSFKNVLEEVANINFLNSQPYIPCSKNLCVEMESMYKPYLLMCTEESLLKEKYLWNSLSHELKYMLFCGTLFLLEGMNDNLWLFRVGYLATIFAKGSEPVISRKTVHSICCQNFSLLMKNWNFGKFESTTMGLIVSDTLRPFLKCGWVCGASCL